MGLSGAADTTPWGPIGYITYKRTYARPVTGGQTEEFPETIERVIKASQEQLGVGFTDDEAADLTQMLLKLKGSVAGRFLWQLGTKTVDSLGLMSLQNCAFIVVNEPVRPFTWAMDGLMLGTGVGFNIQRENVYELPKPMRVSVTRKDTHDADFIVPDSREGWVELLKRVLEAHFINGQSFSFSTVCIRGKGAPIKGFGGIASGPEDLCWGINEINKLLNGRAGNKVRPIDALDIMNILGKVVVAGNVRRSAQIAIGDMDDLQFLSAKRWDLGNIPNWRAMSNNSVVCNDITKLPEQFWEGYKGNGEPYGLINIALSRAVGRLGETQYPDPLVQGYNPCAEQGLESGETCCLAETYLPNITSKAELFKLVEYLYRICKHSMRLKCHAKETEEVVHRNMRMGIGVTGYMQATEEQKGWLSDTYEHLREYDKQYSAARGWPVSIKLTTVKPGGTLSLLAGVTPGCHPSPGGRYYIRRIRMAAESPLIEVCRQHGFNVEPAVNFDGGKDPSTMVVDFPCSDPPHTVFIDDCPAVEQLDNVKRLQSEWSDNSVSCTIRYNPDELDAIREWLRANFNCGVKSCSFMLHHGHGFVQAPFEEISKERYDELVAKSRPITSCEVAETDLEVAECAQGGCPIK